MPLNYHLPGNCSPWNVIVSHRRSRDFSTQRNWYNQPSVILSPRKFLVIQFPLEHVTWMKRLSDWCYYSRIRDRPIPCEDNLGNKAENLELIFVLCIQAARSDTRSNQKKRSRLSLTSNVLFTTTSVVCVMQTMSGTHANTSINALRNTKDRLQSGITSKSSMERSQVTYIVILRSWESAKVNLVSK